MEAITRARMTGRTYTRRCWTMSRQSTPSESSTRTTRTGTDGIEKAGADQRRRGLFSSEARGHRASMQADCKRHPNALHHWLRPFGTEWKRNPAHKVDCIRPGPGQTDRPDANRVCV